MGIGRINNSSTEGYQESMRIDKTQAVVISKMSMMDEKEGEETNRQRGRRRTYP